MPLIRDLVMSASVAVGNVASRERDRSAEGDEADGRPRAFSERARGRVQAMVTEGVAKVTVSQTAFLGARELAKRVGSDSARKVFGALAKRPTAAAGTALFAFDAARDGIRLARGEIESRQFAERVGGNAAGLAGAAVGAQVGAFVGTLAMPLVGTAVGSVVGGVVGGVGGDTYGRRKVRNIVGASEEEEPYEIEFEDEV